MRNHTIVRACVRHATFLSWCLSACVFVAIPSPARAQYSAPPLSNLAIGERYHVEVSATFWNPTLTGTVASEQFGLAGSDLDFVGDLGFERTKFRDLRLVLRPSKKSKIRVRYTPIDYVGQSVLTRNVIFNGILYPISLPVASEFQWKVLRLGYEYDMIYRNRGFFGVIFEGRYTRMFASLESTSPLLTAAEFTKATAPLPAIGVAGRGYIASNVALDFELTGFRAPNFTPKYQANYYDWDIHATVNFTNAAGVQIGWRRVTTLLQMKQDTTDFKFQGMYFGAVARF